MATKDECAVHSHVKILSLSVRVIFLSSPHEWTAFDAVHFWLFAAFLVMCTSAVLLRSDQKSIFVFGKSSLRDFRPVRQSGNTELGPD